MERVGLIFLDRPSLAEQVRLTQYAEQRGLESVWVCETRLARDAVTPLAAFAAVTSRIKLASGVVNNWTRTSALMAMTFATLAELAPGRIILTIGAYWEPLASKQGIHRRKTLTAMREYVDVVRRLLALETVTLEGQVVKVRDLKLDLGYGVPQEPVQVPIYIGATGPKMMELAGEIADGILHNFSPRHNTSNCRWSGPGRAPRRQAATWRTWICPRWWELPCPPTPKRHATPPVTW